MQLNPERPYFVQRKPEKLIRRGPCDYRIVGKNPDGTRAEPRLSAVTFRIEGI